MNSIGCMWAVLSLLRLSISNICRFADKLPHYALNSQRAGFTWEKLSLITEVWPSLPMLGSTSSIMFLTLVSLNYVLTLDKCGFLEHLRYQGHPMSYR